jgi:hypothetical protein
VSRRPKRRLLSLVATLGLLLSLGASAGSVSAADTRLVDIGSTVDCVFSASDPNGGPLALSPVSAGQVTSFDLATQNCGGQKLNNITITVGAQPRTAAGAPIWDQLSVPFTDGTTITDVYATSFQGSAFPANACKTNAAKTLLTCTFKAFQPGQGASMSIGLRASSSAGVTSVDVHTAIKVSENTNDNGSNEDTFEAVANQPFAGDATCDKVYGFFTPSSQSAETCKVANGNPQSAKVGYGSKFTSVQVSEVTGDTQLDAACGTSAIGSDVIADITQDDLGDVIHWTVVIDLKAINMNGVKADDVEVCHLNDEGVKTDVFNYVPTKSNKGILTLEFDTYGNGKSRFT